jgi:serine/threonine-protein kinase
MSDMLDHVTAVLAGSYEIERELGRGGMATVYLARDLRHRRPVAVKVLLPELAAVVGAERFLREIEIAAGLNHPHILSLHDSGQADAVLYYVMPFVDGESLRDRLHRETQLPVEDALRIAAEVADGLSYAHARDVIHRDIKPENVLLADGHAYIADFGIARAVSAAGGTRLTETGLSLGTPQYMSPEQASGDPRVDGRSDQYALGCVVYEMLVGEPPHTGPSAQAIIAKVLTEPVPRVREARETIPVPVDLALGRALARLPADRYVSVEKFAEALAASTSADVTIPTPPAGFDAEPAGRPTDRPWKVATGVAAAVGILGVLVGLWGLRAGRDTAADAVYRLEMPVEPLAVLYHTSSPALALSPDGSRLAYIAGDGNAGQLYLRHMGSSTPMAIPGADDAHTPFFSPDGAWVGFVSGERLRKARVVDGVIHTLGDATELHGAVWGEDGWIVLGGSDENSWGLSRIPAEGGDAEILLQPDGSDGETYMAWPDLLPSGAVLYTSIGPDGTPLALVRFDPASRERRVLMQGGGNARYVRTGHLVFGSAGVLHAVRFDPRDDAVVGQPIAVVENLEDGISREPALSHFTTAPNGTLVYLAGSSGASAQMLLVDRVGTVVEQIGPLGDRVVLPFGPRVAPNGRHVAFWSPSGEGDPAAGVSGNLWVWDRERGGLSLLTRDGADFWSMWLPGGREILATHWPEDGALAVVRRRIGTPGVLEPVVEADRLGQPWAQPYSITRDGSILLLHGSDQGANHNIYWLTMADGSWQAFLDGPDDEAQPAISPDGQWIAFVTDESGQHEVYVADFPDHGERIRVSAQGGLAPVWGPDGRDVYFQTRDGHTSAIVATRIHTGGELRADPPDVLFEGTFDVFAPIGRQYDVLPDGSGFVVVGGATSDTPRDRLTTILNWTAELRQ